MRPCVLIVPGHGGDAPGAQSHGVSEAEVNLAISLETAQVFQDLDWRVHMSRFRDVTQSLEDRVAMEHALAPDLFLGVHCNAFHDPAVHGLEAWTSPGQTLADPFATAILGAWERGLPGFRMRQDFTDKDPDKEAKFFVLTQTRCPAVLLECGFLTNDGDRARITNPETQRQIGQLTAMAADWCLEGVQGTC